MAKEWQTFVRKFEDMKEGELELFIKDLTPGPRKYDTKHVRAKVARSKAALPDGETLWIRSESGTRGLEPFYISIIEVLPEWVEGRPWENVFDAIERKRKKS
ncbi:MAG: phenylphosphate carboxylase subunit gamma [Pseudomonadota bacterium]